MCASPRNLTCFTVSPRERVGSGDKTKTVKLGREGEGGKRRVGGAHLSVGLCMKKSVVSSSWVRVLTVESGWEKPL